MNLQEAVKICRRHTKSEKSHLFARPISWSGTATAVDLGRKLSPDKTHKVCILNSRALTGISWEVDPIDLLDRWQIVTQEQLNREVNNEPGTEE
jgi:hypothetical protein